MSCLGLKLDILVRAGKQTGAKLARIDVSVVGKDAQLAEQEARFLSWTNGVISISNDFFL